MAYPVQDDPTKVFGRRVLAVIIDGLLILVPVVILVTSQFEYYTKDNLAETGRTGQQVCDSLADTNYVCADLTDTSLERVYFAKDVSGSTQALSWLLPLGLFVVLQGLTGWTIGKLICGVRCVQEDGSPPGLVKALVRWLLWIVDGFPYFLPLVGFIVGLTTVGHRRVGDMVAKTFVVRASAMGTPIVVPGLTAPPAPVGAPGGWGTPPPDASGSTTSWGQAVDPSSAGWAATTSTTAAGAPPSDRPQWDEARGTYIQWDAVERAWMQWDEGNRTWSRIPGQ